MTANPRAGRTIGFDLDMTLIDSRPGIGAVYTALAAETGTHIDVELAISRLGPPLTWELAHWFPAEDVPAMADRYRAMYPDVAVPRVRAMPGAHEALSVAREHGRAIVITAKLGVNAAMHLDLLGLAYDAVIGDAWREQKAAALTREGADTYIGDHVHDMEAAQMAGIRGIGVATGPCSVEELTAAGAHVAVGSLLDVPARLTGVGSAD